MKLDWFKNIKIRWQNINLSFNVALISHIERSSEVPEELGLFCLCIVDFDVHKGLNSVEVALSFGKKILYAIKMQWSAVILWSFFHYEIHQPVLFSSPLDGAAPSYMENMWTHLSKTSKKLFQEEQTKFEEYERVTF